MLRIKIKLKAPSVDGLLGNLVYIVTDGKVTKQIPTDYHVFPYEWNKKESTFFPSTDARINSMTLSIKKDLERFSKIITNFDTYGKGCSVLDVVNKFKSEKQGKSFFEFMEEIIVQLKKQNRIGTFFNYVATYKSFHKYCEGKDVMIEDIDRTLIKNYEIKLQEDGLTPNSTSFYMRILRAVYNRAVENELILDRRPFKDVFTGMEKTRKRAIALKDIKRIKNLDLSQTPKLEFSRNLFLFLFYCRGMSFIDAVFLKGSNIRSGIISYRRHKTNQLLQVKMVKEMKDVIDRYHEEGSPYLFPIITGEGNERKQYNHALHKVNSDLKKIGEMIKLSQPLTTYVSRHAWATIAKQKNIPILVISEALGHDSEKTTQIYLASMDMNIIDQANDRIIASL